MAGIEKHFKVAGELHRYEADAHNPMCPVAAYAAFAWDDYHLKLTAPIIARWPDRKTFQEAVDFIPTAQPRVVFTMILYSVTNPRDTPL